jgi:hypothetical protein
MGLHEQSALRARGLFENLLFPVTEHLSQRRSSCLDDETTCILLAATQRGSKDMLSTSGDNRDI